MTMLSSLSAPNASSSPPSLSQCCYRVIEYKEDPNKNKNSSNDNNNHGCSDDDGNDNNNTDWTSYCADEYEVRFMDGEQKQEQPTVEWKKMNNSDNKSYSSSNNNICNKQNNNRRHGSPNKKNHTTRTKDTTNSNVRTWKEQLETCRMYILYQMQRMQRVLFDLFLPINYPHSVEDCYLQYQLYDSLQGLCSYLRGVVSTSAVLKAVGVGNANATALSAAMTWAMKDGLGMLGGLTFSYYASPLFDSYVKEFRLFADIINDIGLALDMMAPYVPYNSLLWLSSCSTLCKTMCGMSAGATKSSITVYFAKGRSGDGSTNNIADLNAKEGTQETLVSLLGMILGVQLAKVLQSLDDEERKETDRNPHPSSSSSSSSLYFYFPTMTTGELIAWISFILLTFLHVWANVRAVKLLKLPTLNRERLSVLLNFIFDDESIRKNNDNDILINDNNNKHHQNHKNHPMDKTTFSINDSTILSPKQMNESLWNSYLTILFPKHQRIQLGVPLNQTLWQQQQQHNDNSSSCSLQQQLLQLFQKENYILNIIHYYHSHYKIMVTLRVGANPHKDQWKAFVHAVLLDKVYYDYYQQQQRYQQQEQQEQQDHHHHHHQQQQLSLNSTMATTSIIYKTIFKTYEQVSYLCDDCIIENDDTDSHLQEKIEDKQDEDNNHENTDGDNNNNNNGHKDNLFDHNKKTSRIPLLKKLELKGWDVTTNRIDLGFSQKRTMWSRMTTTTPGANLNDDNNDDIVVDDEAAPVTTTTKESKKNK